MKSYTKIRAKQCSFILSEGTILFTIPQGQICEVSTRMRRGTICLMRIKDTNELEVLMEPETADVFVEHGLAEIME